MRPEDISSGLDLCRHANWNQLEKDWRIFLAADEAGSIVAEKNSEVIGTAATISYGSFSWIGMVLVHPSQKKQGIGSNLLLEAMQVLRNEKTIKLDATPQGREIYLKLNFHDEYGLSRMVAPGVPTLPSSSNIGVISDSDIDKIAAYDEKIFGANRKKLLNALLINAPLFSFYIEVEGQIKGYCLGRPGFRYTQVGPIVADGLEEARALAVAALNNCTGKPVMMDIFHHSTEWMEWVKKIGFREERSFVRMYHGENNFAGNLEKQFAITGPEFG